MQNLPAPPADHIEQESWAKRFSFAAGALVRQVLGGSCFPYTEVPSATRPECVEAFRRGIEGQSIPHPVEAVREREVVRRR